MDWIRYALSLSGIKGVIKLTVLVQTTKPLCCVCFKYVRYTNPERSMPSSLVANIRRTVVKHRSQVELLITPVYGGVRGQKGRRDFPTLARSRSKWVCLLAGRPLPSAAAAFQIREVKRDSRSVQTSHLLHRSPRLPINGN